MLTSMHSHSRARSMGSLPLFQRRQGVGCGDPVRFRGASLRAVKPPRGALQVLVDGPAVVVAGGDGRGDRNDI